MPASKKDLKKLAQKKNVAAGIGDDKGRLPSNNKVGFIVTSVEELIFSVPFWLPGSVTRRP